MKRLNIIIIFVLTFFSVSILSADVYVWTDEKGVKHYSDHPPENVDDYEIQKESQPNQNDQQTNNEQTDAEQDHVQEFIKDADKNYEKQRQEEKLKAEEAQKNQPPTQEEKIAAEKEKLEMKIAELEEQPLEYFGSQKNKRTRIGYYRYRLEALLENPDKYFKNPESFEGNVKESE